jgi:hypothetical protein
MIGPLLVIAFMVLVFPVGLSLSGAVVAALHGHFATTDAEERFEGSELLELSKRAWRPRGTIAALSGGGPQARLRRVRGRMAPDRVTTPSGTGRSGSRRCAPSG